MKKFVIAYHAYLYGDHYMDMITEQLRKIINVKIYKDGQYEDNIFSHCKKLYIGVTDSPGKKPENGIEWLTKFVNASSSNKQLTTDPKIEIVVSENNELRPTLWWIRDYAKDHPGEYVMFFHTKGITHGDQPNRDWRNYMEYFVIERWRDCIKKLDDGYDCCGVLWNCDKAGNFHPHFSGAFWWASTDYINTLDHNYLTSANRYDGEFWIGTNKNARVYEFHNSRMNDYMSLLAGKSHYNIPFPRSSYVQSLTALNIENRQFLSDKGVLHPYLEKYEELFESYRDKEINIFEVGFQYGGSCRLWEKYFAYAKIRAIDINEYPTSPDELAGAKIHNMNTQIHTGPRVLKEVKDINELTEDYFADFIPDIAIDDGSHKPEDQLTFVKTVYPVLRKGGLLIIEDVPDIENQIDDFKELGLPFSIIDWRSETKVTDDVILIFRK
jgi:hypothetical protein